MPGKQKLQKASLRRVELGKDPKPLNPRIEVQFNPESLKLAYANTTQSNNPAGGSSVQFVTTASTKLSFDLWFDVSAPPPSRVLEGGGADNGPVKDVRKLTHYIVQFMQPTAQQSKDDTGQTASNIAPPGVRFEWGAFVFDGIVESISETLDFFSPEGYALRSQLSVSMSKQDIPADLASNTSAGPPSPGINFQTPALAGDTLQSLADAAGAVDDWQDIATINDIENPRDLGVGTLLNLGQ
jgi:hypothetical protein